MLRRLHSFPGLAAAVLVVVLAASGAVLSVDPALERASATVPPAGAVSVADLAAGVEKTVPGVERIVRQPNGTVIAYHSGPAGPAADVVDPLTGGSLGPYRPSTFTAVVTRLHRQLLLGDGGRLVAGAGAAAMVLLCLSGAMMLAKRLGGWRRLFRRIRGTPAQRLHAGIGRLALAGLLLSSLTGVYMSLATFAIVPDGLETQPAFPAAVTQGTRMRVGELPALRRVDLGDLRELTFPYPDDPTDVFSLTTSAGSGYVDPVDGALVNWLPNGPARRIYETIYMLHTGAGLWWLGLLLGLSATAVPVMAASGPLIYLARRRAMPRMPRNVGAQAAEAIILVGSESNGTWGFAATLHQALADAGYAVHTAAMNRFRGRYRAARHVFILAATYGDGRAPASARQFLSRLDRLDGDPGYDVTVLGFGDRSFPHFCRYADRVAAALAERGVPMLLPPSRIDRQSSQEFGRWGDRVGEALGIDLVLRHVPPAPATRPLRLVERIDYGAEVQAPTAVLRFEPAEPDGSRWRRWFGLRSPGYEPGDLLGVVPPGDTVPRFYSMASGSGDRFLEICVRKHPGGLCSGYLCALQPGDVIDGFIRANPDFRPARGRTPVIMIGAGTGIGPLAGFIRQNRDGRPMHLYFGGRDPGSDFLYEADLADWLADRRLTSLRTAFSRVNGRTYVQDRVAADAGRMGELLADGGQILVCGGREMGEGVMQVIDDMATPLGGVAALKEQGRYLEDVY